MDLKQFKTVEQLAAAIKTLIASPATRYNVKQYGATGDGVTDDSTAIQACIDAAPNDSTIYFPNGAFYFATELKVHGGSFKTFTGPGVIRPDGCAAFSIEETAAGDSCEFMRFKDLHIRGTDTTETIFDIDVAAGGGGVREIHIDNCNFWDFLYGVRATVGAGQMHGVTIRNCRLTNDDIAGSVGLFMECPDNLIKHNVIRGCETAIALESGGNRVDGNHIYSTPSTTTDCHLAIRRNASSGVSNGHVIVGNFFDGDPDDGQIIIDIQYSGSYTITGNAFLTAAAKGPFIELEAGSGWDVTDLTIIGNTFVSRTATKTNGFNLAANVQTDDASDFHIHSNTWGSATPFSTSEEVRQTGTYAATFVPNPMLGRTIVLTLTGNVTIDTPTNPNMGGIGNRLTFVIIQDGTGSRTVGWNAVYKQAWSDTGFAASKRSTITFEWDGTNWNQVGGQSPYA